jgi:hypothetical protein
MRQRSTARLSIATSALLLLGLGAKTEAAIAATKPKPPTAKQALRILVGSGNVSIVGNASCETVKQPGDKTLADYLSTVMAAQTDETIRWQTKVKTAMKKGRWQVDIEFLGEDPSDVYDKGIRFTLNPDGRTIASGSVFCTGTS